MTGDQSASDDDDDEICVDDDRNDTLNEAPYSVTSPSVHSGKAFYFTNLARWSHSLLHYFNVITENY